MNQKGSDPEMTFGSLLNDIPTLDDVRLEGGFFAGVDRGEWIRNLEHHFRYGEELLMLWGEPGVGKSTLMTQLASRLDPDVFMVVTMDARRGGSAEHLWGALDKRLSLPHGAEGWEALKRTAKKLASCGQSLAIIIDHADKLNKEAVQLLRAILDVHLPECRFVLAMDGTGVATQGQWPAIEAQLFERGQLARLWPFAEEDAFTYIEFRMQHAQLGDVALTDKQKQRIYERSEGNAGLIKAEMQRLLAAGELVGKPVKSGRKSASAPAKKSAAKPAAPAQKPAKSKRPLVLPKAHTVAMSVLAVALTAFYFMWEKPVPSSTIATPSPTAQSLPPVIKTEELAALPATTQMENEPPASGGMPSPIKSLPADDVRGDGRQMALADAGAGAISAEPASSSSLLSSQPHVQPPTGFVPSNVPLMATQPAVDKAMAADEAEAPVLKVPPSRPVAGSIKSKPEAALTSRSPATIAPPPAAAVKTMAKTPAVKPVVAKDASVTPPTKTQASSKPVPKPVIVAKAAPASVKSGGAYTLQIMGLRDLRSVQQFMQRNAGVSGLRYHTSTLNGEPWYVIVQGEYASRQAAQAAVKTLPAALQASKPFPKNVSALQGGH